MNYFVNYFIELKDLIPNRIAHGKTGRLGLEYHTIKVYKCYLPWTIACGDKKYCPVSSISSKNKDMKLIFWAPFIGLQFLY